MAGNTATDGRGGFASHFGFVMAAAGSAVGLGNVWGFPGQAAENGGGAFVLVYLVLAAALAYPVLITEFLLGRASQSGIVGALRAASGRPWWRFPALGIGFWGIVTASLILSFYSLVGGWVLGHALYPWLMLAGWDGAAAWLVEFSLGRNLLLCALFSIGTCAIVSAGVAGGIERWSRLLMPLFLLLLLALIGYVMTLDGALAGLRAYLVPDFGGAMRPGLMVSAMGQAFFSLSLGVGTMLVYGSYISRKAHLPKLGMQVAALDVGVAFMAGMLIIPALYAALNASLDIHSNGSLVAGDQLLFAVLPQLFATLDAAQWPVYALFFLLMLIATLTSSISMLEVPVAFAVDNFAVRRRLAAAGVAALVFVVSALIAANFGDLFGAVVALTTRYSQPLLGMLLCLAAGWVYSRGALLAELQRGNPGAEDSWFWRIWPGYVRWVCPPVILAIFVQSLYGS